MGIPCDRFLRSGYPPSHSQDLKPQRKTYIYRYFTFYKIYVFVVSEFDRSEFDPSIYPSHVYGLPKLIVSGSRISSILADAIILL